MPNRSLTDEVAVDLYIFGAGQIAEVTGAFFEDSDQYSDIYYVVDVEFLDRKHELNGTLLSWDEALERAERGVDYWFTAMSYKKRNAPRAAAAQRIKDAGFDLASFVHPTASVWSGFEVQENSMIMEKNVLQLKSALGANSIVWSNNHIGHHTVIGDNTFISSEVCISGNCSIGSGCFFGVNSTVFDGITIGDDAIIAAGAVVSGDVAAGAVVR